MLSKGWSCGVYKSCINEVEERIVRNRISGTSIAVLALVFPMVALAQVSISPPSQSVANAGDTAPYVVTVTNPTGSTQTFVPSWTGIPASWGVQYVFSVTVAAGGSQNFNFVLTTALGQAAGSYPFTVILTTAGNLSYSTQGTLIINSSIAPHTVPTLSEWGMFLLAALLAGTAALALRRSTQRRASAPQA
jgi:uncharacterized membrane protein